MRRIKALSFLEIDCLEFRHLELNGASALYFDLVQRLRRADAAESALAAESEPQAPPSLREAPIPPARAQVADHIPVQTRLVLAPAFRI